MTRRPTLAAQAVPPLLVLAGACAPSPSQEGDADGHAETEAGPSNRVEIPALVRRNLGITFVEVEARRVAETIRVPGAFELRPVARREYRMALPGRVELRVEQYEEVEEGQTLYRFQSPAWPELLHEIIVGEQDILLASAEIDVARARVEEAEASLETVRERIAALAGAEFRRADLEAGAAELEASLPRLAAELELARTRLVNARRTREHALHRASTAADIPEAELERPVEGPSGETVPRYETIDWIEVRAVEAGVVEELAVTDGAFVEPPGIVLSTVDPARVRFRALALQGDLPKLSGAGEARIVPPRSPEIPIGDSVPAQVTFGLEAHPEERIITLVATPDELAPWIRPGVSAFLEVVVDATAAPALAIPRSAIVRDGLGHVFFRRDPRDPDAAVMVEADMGVGDGRWVVLESGVARGDQVVLSGAYELKLAVDKSGAPDRGGGHVHADGTTHADH